MSVKTFVRNFLIHNILVTSVWISIGLPIGVAQEARIYVYMCTDGGPYTRDNPSRHGWLFVGAHRSIPAGDTNRIIGQCENPDPRVSYCTTAIGRNRAPIICVPSLRGRLVTATGPVANVYIR